MSEHARPVDGIPWLTNRERDFLAHLTTVTIARQVPHGYDAVSEALEALAGEGQVRLRADDANVYVLIAGRVIVHAERRWLAWAATVQTNEPPLTTSHGLGRMLSHISTGVVGKLEVGPCPTCSTSSRTGAVRPEPLAMKY